jgi:Ribosomal protein L10
MPSKSILAEKEALVEELSGKVQNAASGVVVDYKGITVEQDTELRTALRKAGVEYKVYKNSMTGRACEKAGYPGMVEYLKGMTAFAISANDPVAPAKILKEYADKIPTFELKAGFVDGNVIDAKGVEALAAVPSKEILIAKMMGSLQSSLYGFAYAIQAIIDKENGGATEEAPVENAEA